jgi:O-antigen/teichoic acid export membrane protein
VLAAGTGLLGRFAYLILTQIFVVGFGIGYWIVTARLVPAHEIGLAAAAVSAGIFFSAVAALGVSSLVLVELARVPERERRVVLLTGVVVAGAASAMLAGVAWWLLLIADPHVSGTFGFLIHSPVSGVLVVAGTVGTTAGGIFDAASISLGRSRVQLGRNMVSASLRVLFVIALVHLGVRSATGLLAAWTGSIAISLLLSPRSLIPRVGGEQLHVATMRRVLRAYRAAALRHHLLNLAITSVSFFLPLLAAILLVPTDYAYFAIAQLISSTIMLVPALLAVSLFAERSEDEQALRGHIRRTLPLALTCSVLALALLEPGAGVVLRIFGSEYASHGSTVLRLLLLGGLSYVVKDHFVAIRRAQGRLSEAARTVAVMTCGEAALTALGAALYGVNGLCGFWVMATVIEAAIFAPTVWRVVRKPVTTGRVNPEFDRGNPAASSPAAAPSSATSSSPATSAGPATSSSPATSSG